MIPVLRRHLRQRRRHVQLRYRRRGCPYALRLRTRAPPHIGEKILLQAQDLLLRVQHLVFVFLQLRVVNRSALASVCLRS